jgi:hypothetical protein
MGVQKESGLQPLQRGRVRKLCLLRRCCFAQQHGPDAHRRVLPSAQGQDYSTISVRTLPSCLLPRDHAGPRHIAANVSLQSTGKSSDLTEAATEPRIGKTRICAPAKSFAIISDDGVPRHREELWRGSQNTWRPDPVGAEGGGRSATIILTGPVASITDVTIVRPHREVHPSIF